MISTSRPDLEKVKNMIVGVPEEGKNESRVGLDPRSASELIQAGHKVLVESGAGEKSGFSDSDYQEAGVKILSEAEEILRRADTVVHVQNTLFDSRDNNPGYREGQLVLGLLDPHGNKELFESFASWGVSSMVLELIPRISRAQKMDALTSQGNIAGYKAAIIGAGELPRIFPMMMTAAGTIKPARVLVIGAGVAGLQAIATAKRLGAKVETYDIRLEVKEQVESLGADFVELDLETEDSGDESGYAREMDEKFYEEQRRCLSEVLEHTDVVISTASIPGRRAPELIDEEMVKKMPAGSVIVDVAAKSGGNCVLTRPDRTDKVHDVKIIGPTNLPAKVPRHSSQLYANNVTALIDEITDGERLHLNLEDELIDSILITHEGELRKPGLYKNNKRENHMENKEES